MKSISGFLAALLLAGFAKADPPARPTCQLLRQGTATVSITKSSFVQDGPDWKEKQEQVCTKKILVNVTVGPATDTACNVPSGADQVICDVTLDGHPDSISVNMGITLNNLNRPGATPGKGFYAFAVTKNDPVEAHRLRNANAFTRDPNLNELMLFIEPPFRKSTDLSDRIFITADLEDNNAPQ